MRKFAIAPAGLKLDFWPSSQWYFSAFEGPTAKIQVWCYSTHGVVYKYVKITNSEVTQRFLWNAKLSHSILRPNFAQVADNVGPCAAGFSVKQYFIQATFEHTFTL